MADMELRTIEMRLASDAPAERSVTGLAVPYAQDANIGGVYNERFAPGSIPDVKTSNFFITIQNQLAKSLSAVKLQTVMKSPLL